jgi:hypothetical protein
VQTVGSRADNSHQTRRHGAAAGRPRQVFHAARELTLWDAVRALRVKLYDERGRRLVTFAEAAAIAPWPSRADPWRKR